MTAPRTGRTPLTALTEQAGPGLLSVRSAGNWLNLSTPTGLLVAALGRARIRRGGRGLWFAEGYRPGVPTGAAFTLGNVITTASPSIDDLRRTIPAIVDHEEAHTWQYTLACGLPLLPAYAVCVAWSWLRTGDRASANPFERRAGLAAGGYVESPPRRITDGLRAGIRLLGDVAATWRTPPLTRSGGRRCACAGGSRGAGAGA